MPDKNLFSIGEIAKVLGITRRIILNYEEKGLVTPDRKDGTTGNRYYSIDTFTRIRAIRVFQDLGLSLDEARKYFDGDTDLEPIIKRLEKMRDELNLTIEKLKERTPRNNAVTEIMTEPQTVYRRKYDSVTIEDKTQTLRATAIEAMRLYGTDTTKRMYFTEISPSAPTTVYYCVSVPADSEGEFIQHIPGAKALSYFHHGSYEGAIEARQKLVEYAKEHNIRLSGVFKSIFLEGPPQHKDPSKYITQIIAMVRE